MRVRLPRYVAIAVQIITCMLVFGNLCIFSKDTTCILLGFIYSGFFILTLLYACFKGLSDKNMLNMVLTAFLFSFVGMVGSNTGFAKHLSVMMFPIAIGIAYPLLSRSYIRFCVAFFIITGCFGPVNKYYGLFLNGGGIMSSTATPMNPLFEGVKTTPERAKMLDEYTAFVQQIKQDDFICVGSDANRFVIDYMRGARSPFMQNSWENGLLSRQDYVESVVSHISCIGSPLTLMILKSPSDKEQQPMTKACLELKPSEVCETDYYIALRFVPKVK